MNYPSLLRLTSAAGPRPPTSGGRQCHDDKLSETPKGECSQRHANVKGGLGNAQVCLTATSVGGRMRVRAKLTMRCHAPLNNSAAEVRQEPFFNMRIGNDGDEVDRRKKDTECRPFLRKDSKYHTCTAYCILELNVWVSNWEQFPVGSAKCDNSQGWPNVKYALVVHIQMPHDTLSIQRYKHTGNISRIEAIKVSLARGMLEFPQSMLGNIRSAMDLMGKYSNNYNQMAVFILTTINQLT